MAKKPKKPKANAGLARWQKYDAAVTKWHSDRKKLETLKKKHS